MLLPDLSDRRYQIVKILGQGGSADVYLARHLALGELRVLKILHQDILPDSKRRTRFLQEAKLAAHLKHPAIVRVFDVTQTRASLQIEMEYIEGQSLRQYLEQKSRLPPPVAVAVIEAVLEGLEHAHAATLNFDGVEYDGVIHRDLKPENILLRRDGQPVICDFGIAKLGADLLSMTQNVSGSVPYMAPERLRGENSTRAIDVFALGVMLFEILAGFRPFRGDNRTEVIENILKWNIADIRADLPDLDPALLEILQRALARDPSDRYADAGQMRAALGPLYKQYHGEAPPRQVIGEFLRLGRITTTEFRALLPEESFWSRRLWWWGLPAVAVLGLTAVLVGRPAFLHAPQGFAALAAAGKLKQAAEHLPTEPQTRQAACFALAQDYWQRRDAQTALWWTDQALDAGPHPRMYALRAEIYLDRGLRNRARDELDREHPFLGRSSVETQAQYYWLLSRWLHAVPSPLAAGQRRELRASLEAVLKLVGNPTDPRHVAARQWLVDLH